MASHGPFSLPRHLMPLNPVRLRRLGLGMLAGLAGALLIVAFARTDSWKALESRALGAVLSRRPAPPMSDQVVLVAIDDTTYRRLDQMVLRSHQAKVLELLNRAGAKTVAYDMFFLTTAREGPEGDRLLAEAARRFGRAVAPTECSEDAGALPTRLSQRGLLSPGLTPAFACTRPVLPQQPFQSSMLAAHLQLPVTPSGHARGVFALAAVGEQRLPSLALAAWIAGEGLAPTDVQQRARSLELPGRTIAIGPDGATLTSYRGMPRKQQVLSFADLLEAADSEPTPQLRQRVADKFVIVALTAKSAGDYIELSTGEYSPAVVLHLAFLSDLIEGRTVTSLPEGTAAAMILALALLSSLAAGVLRQWQLLFALIAVTFAVLLGIEALVAADVWVGPIAPVMASWGAAGAALSVRLIREEATRKTLETAFRSYVDASVLERILSDPEKFLSLGGARKRVTLLFSDIEGYTRLSNTLPTENVLGLLREYLEVMTGRVMKAEGRVDKIMGDGILAVFGDPIPLESPSSRALSVALAMQEEVEARRADWEARWGVVVRIRIGIATGEVFVGNVGGKNAKIEYTVLGPSVNLAARLQSVTLPDTVLICEATRQECGPDYALTRVDGLTLKGYAEGQHAYRVSRASKVATG